MSLCLSADHPQRALLEAQGVACLSEQEARDLPRVRVGILNLMPSALRYERLLLTALCRGPALVEPSWLRLPAVSYPSSDHEHVARYREYDQAQQQGTLHGLILTGAPVEELPFEQVPYWHELTVLLTRARHEVPSTFGLCWGGMALAKLLGVEKRLYTEKLFGNFALEATRDRERTNLAGQGTLFCAQSRHAGVDEQTFGRALADQRVRLLAHSERTGPTVFESGDGRYLMHLGHPEYDRERLLLEYQRDLRLGRSDVPAPEGVELSEGGTPLVSHGPDMFTRWLAELG